MCKFVYILLGSILSIVCMTSLTHAATIYVSSGETTGFTIAQQQYADTFDDTRKSGFDPIVNNSGFVFQTYVRTATGVSSTIQNITMPTCPGGNAINVAISARNYTGLDPRGQLISPSLPEININAGITLQDGAVYPQSLYNTPFWNENIGANSSKNAILYEFSETVYGFGAWLGDVETRSDGQGVVAQVILLDSSLAVVASGPILPSLDTGLQVNCGGTSASNSITACGNETTRFVGFSDPNKQVKYMVVVVGDDDSAIGSNDGGTEHLSFVGPTVSCPLADLMISKQVSTGIAQSGDLISYTINFANLLYGTAYQSQITDLFPTTYMDYLSSSVTVNNTILAFSPVWSGSYLIWSGIDIGGQQTGQIIITGIVNTNAYTVSGWLNTATIWATGETNTGNNIGTAWVESMPYDLTIEKTVNTSEAMIGDEITYTITYSNNGPATANNVVIQDVFPNNILSLDSSDPVYDANENNIYAWNIGTLYAGQTGQIIITGTVLTSVIGDEAVINTGMIGKGNLTGTLSFVGESNTGNNISRTSGDTIIHDLALIKTLSIGESSLVTSGSNVTFTITVYNQGNRTVDFVSLLDYIPTGMQLQDSDRTNLGSLSGVTYAGYAFPQPLNLLPGASVSTDITVLVDGTITGNLTNMSEINDNDGSTSGGDDDDIDSTTDGYRDNDFFDTSTDDSLTGVEDDHDGATITVVEGPLYKINKTLITDNPKPGDVISYRIDYEMIYQTPSVYFDVVIKDMLGTGLIFSGFAEHYDVWSQQHPGSLIGAGETGMINIGGQDIYYYSLGNGTITGGYNSGYVIIQAIVDPSLGCASQISNRAGYSGPDGYEFNPANRWVEDTANYTIPCVSDIWIQKTPITGIYLSGDSVARQLIYGNNGPDAAYDVVITEHGGIRNSAISGSIYSIGMLTAGQTGSMIVSGVVYGQSGDTVKNTISIHTDSPETNTGDNSDETEIILGGTNIMPPLLNSIAGIVYLDINHDSGYNYGDGGISGMIVGLYLDNVLIATGLTSSTGFYQFVNIKNGRYNVSYLNHTAYIPYVSNTGTINSFLIGNSVGAMILSNIVVAGGQDSIDNNFGLVTSMIAYIHSSNSNNGGAYIPYDTQISTNTTFPTSESPTSDTITPQDLLKQIDIIKPLTKPKSKATVLPTSIMPKTGASIGKKK